MTLRFDLLGWNLARGGDKAVHLSCGLNALGIRRSLSRYKEGWVVLEH